MDTFTTIFYRLFSLSAPRRAGKTRNYRGILSLTYRWGAQDQAEKKLSKSTRLKQKMMELVATQKKAQIRERIQFLSDNFLNQSNHGTTQTISPPGADRVSA